MVQIPEKLDINKKNCGVDFDQSKLY